MRRRQGAGATQEQRLGVRVPSQRQLSAANAAEGTASWAAFSTHRSSCSRGLASPARVPASQSRGSPRHSALSQRHRDWEVLGHFLYPLQILPGCAFWAGDSLGSHCWRLSYRVSPRPCRVPPSQAEGSTFLVQEAWRPESLGTATAPCKLWGI